jgi:tRNA-2-methylthio-N6-dimethylallyladenosine synthase
MLKLDAMKYYLWILGCAMNYSDAERIAAVLDLLGYQKTENEAEADLIITVACSVRQKAVDRIHGKARQWQRVKRKRPLLTALSGCVLEKDKKKMGEVFDFMFEVSEMGELPKLLKENGKTLEKFEDYLSLHPKYDSSFQAYIPIMTGCNNFCSYCAVPYTRGREKSRKRDEITAEVKELIKKGYKEITLLGQNVNSYQYGFTELLREIDGIPGEYRVYFYSNHPKDMSDDLISLLPNLKHFPHYIHLPLQSGNDGILKAMNRHYTKKEYLNLVGRIRKVLPDVSLTTDIIVGFPGEAEKEFADTEEVMEKAMFDMAFLAQYSERPGTASAKLKDDVSKEVKGRRDRILTEILAKTTYENNKHLKGKTIRVLVDSKRKGIYYGRTDSYKVVEITDSKTDLVGRFCEIMIMEVGPWKLIGELV